MEEEFLRGFQNSFSREDLQTYIKNLTNLPFLADLCAKHVFEDGLMKPGLTLDEFIEKTEAISDNKDLPLDELDVFVRKIENLRHSNNYE